MKDFKKVQIWQRRHQITLSIYKISSKFPREGIYGLTSQILRCSFSAPSNIAEGCGRNSDA
jgi:four helix bundle protein